MLMVNALAGTGKTSTGTWGLGSRVPKDVRVSDEQKAIIKLMRTYTGSQAAMAFNRSIADKLKEEAPKSCVCNTSNGFGHQAWARHLNMKLGLPDNLKNRKICRELIGQRFPWKERIRIESAVDGIVGLCKSYLFDPHTSERKNWLHGDISVDGHEAMLWICDRFDIDNDPVILEYAVSTFLKGVEPNAFIDWDDQIFLPLYHDISLPVYDHVMVDECLPGWTPVMLANGSSMTIEAIVNSTEDIYVRCLDVDGKRGSINCKVTAKQKILNQKPLVKVKVKQSIRTGTNRKSNFVICTIDHKVWTENRGWVPAGDILVGDTVIVETAAITTQKGKITSKGRRYLSDTMQGNNRGKNVKQNNSSKSNLTGGNGTGLTLAEEVLLKELGNGWVGNHIVKTRTGIRVEGTPNHYKIDLADPVNKIAVEVDGHSHQNAKARERDKRKDKFLELNGWKVFRVSNRQAIQKAKESACMILGLEDCPIYAEVTSIEDVDIQDNYVYDITVEDCHNFYANGILVHNCQDLNRAKQELAFRMAKNITAVGDRNQAIYGFAGADSEAMQNMWLRMQQLDSSATMLPLTITRRNPRKVVELANQLVPELKAREDAPDGIVENMSMDKFHKSVGDIPSMVVCRVNAPLSSLAFKLLSQGKRCYIQGRDIGAGLKSEIKRTGENELSTALSVVHDRIERRKIEILQRDFPDENQIEALNDKLACIDILAGDADTVEEFNGIVDRLFKDSGDKKDTRLSSIHKAKGLEHPIVHVYMSNKLMQNFTKKGRKKQVFQDEQEKNLAYVAYTRSMSELYRIPEEKKEREYDYE